MKDQKIKELKGYIEGYQKTLKRLNELKIALDNYDKENINKTFFVKYFSRKDDDGKVLLNWKGEVSTDFYFSDPSYSFEKGKKIFINNSLYIENIIQKTKTEILGLVNEKIGHVSNWINTDQNRIISLENFNQDKFIADMRAIYVKYGEPEFWTELLNIYEVKYIK